MDSNPYSGLEVDSITPYQSYIDKAKELEMKAIAFTEHGAVLHNVAKKQSCEKAGIKYINAEEFYVTEKIDIDNLVRDNYHCCLYAKNHDGVLELNKLSSNAFNRDDGHFYYNPRITLEELENTSDNILVLTACIGGMLCKGTKEVQERFLKFIIKNKHRCWLEIQPHNFDVQIQYNRYLYQISLKYGLRLIATNDVHAIDKEHMSGRAIMQKSKKVNFHDEDDCDLSFKLYDEFVKSFEIQNSVARDIYLDAIEETNRFADLIQPHELDYSNKYPRLYKNAEEEFKDRIKKGIKERKIDNLPNYKTEYIPRIQEELKTYKRNDAIDFMLLDADYKLWLLENNMNYGVSRGSVSGSEIAYLLHNTDVDSVKYKLNFSRFMNPERMSLADVDTDIYAEDRYKVREFLFNKEGLHCCNIITFNTIQLKAAIKDIGRAFDMTPDETQELSNMVQQDEKKRDYMPEEIRSKYPEMFKYIDMVIGTITSLGRHAAGIVCSPTDIEYDFGTLSIKSDPRPVSQIDMHEIDSLNYVKLDLLGLNAVGLIDGACKLAGIDYLTPDNVDFTDENVISSIAEDTTLIFQFESGFASDLLKLTLSKESIVNMKKQSDSISYLDIMAMVNGAIRPSGESYRNDMSQGIYKDNGNKELNEFLKPTLGYLIYQEQIIDFLHDFCGFTMGQADIVRRHFAKKHPEEMEKDIPVIENGGYMVDIKGNKDPKYVKGFISVAQEKYGMTKKEAEKTIKYFVKVIDDASLYIFSKNHAVPYSMIGFFIGWLRCYYKIELLTSALNVYQDNNEKMNNIKAYINSQGIDIQGIRFGKSKADYFMDKEENTIYQGIASIKYCNVDIANELYELAHKNNYNTFVELLVDIGEKTSVNAKQLTILTGLNFFSALGNNKYLLNVIDIYNNFYSIKQVKKADLERLGLNEFLMKKYGNKETEKMYKEIDTKGLVTELCSKLEDKPMSIIEHIKFEMEYLGCTTYINPKVNKDYYVVLDFKTYKNPATPYLLVRDIKTGEEIKTKITSSKIFKLSPFGQYSIIKIYEFRDQFKKKKVGEDWIPTNEIEKIITAFECIK
jgi:DNA polymerase-3 subunit alpha